MKIFLVTEGEYSDYRVVTAALMRSKAEEFLADDIDPATGHSKRGRYAYTYQIEEMEALS